MNNPKINYAGYKIYWSNLPMVNCKVFTPCEYSVWFTAKTPEQAILKAINWIEKEGEG